MEASRAVRDGRETAVEKAMIQVPGLDWSGSTVELGLELGRRATPGRDPEEAVRLDWSARW